MSDYGITFGPDGKGDCIKDTDSSDGIGRFPTYHGTNKDGGYRYSSFQQAMWNAYRNSASSVHPWKAGPIMASTYRINVWQNPFFKASNYMIIDFILPAAGYTQLSIVTSSGQEVQELVHAELDAGAHQVNWNFRDALNRSIKSGIYYLVLHGNHKTEIKKIVVL
jgi:hypothetical protein